MLYFIASKLLSFLINPMVWILILLLLALRNKKLRKVYLMTILGVVLVLGNTYVTNFFIKKWESKQSIQTSQLEKYSTYIILGGYNEWNPITSMQDCNAAGDRLYNLLPQAQDSTKTILITGGSARLRQPTLKEADITRRYLEQFSFPGIFLYENKSRNTQENILYCKEIVDSLQLENIIVVSSAMHMRRVAKILKKQNLNWAHGGVESAAELNPTLLDILMPKADNLSKWYGILHEWVGYFVA